ncbi:MAG: hypothetical protein [Caudoviricetes sp.]|nr:MAG: hypothetical protein [Caudoviricetes sp.]
MLYRVTDSSNYFYDKVGKSLGQTECTILLEFVGYGPSRWISRKDLVIVDEPPFKLNDAVVITLNDQFEYGVITMVAETYYKVRINEGPNKNREIVRYVGDVHADVTRESAEYILTYTRKGLFHTKTFPYEQAMIDFLNENSKLEDLSYRKRTTRIDLPKKINTKIVYVL